MENNNYKSAEDDTLVTILNRANELIQKSRRHLNQNALRNLISNIDNLQKQDIVIGKSATERDNKENKNTTNNLITTQQVVAKIVMKQQKLTKPVEINNGDISQPPTSANQVLKDGDEDKQQIIKSNEPATTINTQDSQPSQPLIQKQTSYIKEQSIEDPDYFFDNFDKMIKINFSGSQINSQKTSTVRKSLQRDFENQLQNEKTVKKIPPPRINSINNLDQKLLSQPETCMNYQTREQSSRTSQDNTRRGSQQNFVNQMQQQQQTGKVQIRQGACGSFVGGFNQSGTLNQQNTFLRDKENQPGMANNNQKLFYKPPPKLDHSRINSFALYGERLNTVGENNFFYNCNNSFLRDDAQHPLNITSNCNYSSRSQVSFNGRPPQQQQLQQFPLQSIIGSSFVGPRSSSLPRGAVIMPSRVIF